MRILLSAVGTRGDVQPALALGVRLKQAGYEVRVAAFQDYRELVSGYGLEFFPLQMDMQALTSRYTRTGVMESGMLAIRFLPELMGMMQRIYEQMAQDFLSASQDCAALVGSPAAFWLTSAVASKLGMAYFESSMFPGTPTQAFPSIFWPWHSNPGTGGGLRGWYNRLTYGLFSGPIWLVMRPVVNRCRTKILGLPPLALFGKLGKPEAQAAPLLVGFSEHVIPRPADWGEQVYVTGYWFLDTPAYEPPADLAKFLAGGPPPVYVGSGSMPSHDPKQMAALATRALRLAGQRGLLFTGLGVAGRGMQQPGSAEDVFSLESAPHDWLFPRMAAVVHHGGAGTTAAGLRVGVPSILVPIVADQLLWAQRAGALGVGPKPIPRSRLTAERLAEAITQAENDPELRQRAAALGEKIRAEDGVGEALRIIEQHLR